jgi:hypothetical protein
MLHQPQFSVDGHRLDGLQSQVAVFAEVGCVEGGERVSGKLLPQDGIEDDGLDVSGLPSGNHGIPKANQDVGQGSAVEDLQILR